MLSIRYGIQPVLSVARGPVRGDHLPRQAGLHHQLRLLPTRKVLKIVAFFHKDVWGVGARTQTLISTQNGVHLSIRTFLECFYYTNTFALFPNTNP